ncbi:MAG: MerR family transcriptional regulator [Ruminococcus sp.]|nr:MerR family transcriptional regulator [Ruminococcus sp.]
MKMQISEIAGIAGVSVRTLQYYDSIDLLKPSETDSNGYRLYDESSLERLNRILYYRSLDFSLKDISQLLDQRETALTYKMLAERRLALVFLKKRAERMIEEIDKSLSEPAKIAPWFDKVQADYNYSGLTYSSDFFFTWGKADHEKNTPYTLDSRFAFGWVRELFSMFCGIEFERQGLSDPDTPAERYFGGTLLEKISGKPLEEIFEEYIFTPFGMDNTTIGGHIDVVGLFGNDICEDPREIVTTAADLKKFTDVILSRKSELKKMICYCLCDNGEFRVYSELGGVHAELYIEPDKNKYFITVCQSDAVPDNEERVMYYPIAGSDDGYLKFEVWTVASGAEFEVRSIKLFDKNAVEFFSEENVGIHVLNNGEEKKKKKFMSRGKYYRELNLRDILGEKFDTKETYIAEVRAKSETMRSGQMGMIYMHDGEWQSRVFNVFYPQNAYDKYNLFLEALRTATLHERENE